MLEIIQLPTLFIFGLGLPEILMIFMIIIVLAGPDKVMKRLKSVVGSIRAAVNEDDDKKIVAKEDEISKEKTNKESD